MWQYQSTNPFQPGEWLTAEKTYETREKAWEAATAWVWSTLDNVNILVGVRLLKREE